MSTRSKEANRVFDNYNTEKLGLADGRWLKAWFGWIDFLQTA